MTQDLRRTSPTANEYRLAMPSIAHPDFLTSVRDMMDLLPPLDLLVLSLHQCERDSVNNTSALAAGMRLMAIPGPELDSLRATAKALLEGS